MTDQSPNDLFHASSFMQGHNAEYLEQLYARYANDPNAVDAAWKSFFDALGDGDDDVKAEAAGHPLVKAVLETFPGSTIEEVRPPPAPETGQGVAHESEEDRDGG